MESTDTDPWRPSVLPGRPIQDLLAPKRTHFGLSTHRKGPSRLSTELKVRLQSLALGDETQDALAEVDVALGSSFSGGAGIRTLLCWGGRESQARLERIGRAWLENTGRSSALWTMEEGAKQEYLARLDPFSELKRRCGEARDQFERWTCLFGVELYPPLFRALPRAESQELLERVLRASLGDARVRLAFTVIDRRKWRDRDAVLKALAAGSDKAAQLARTALLDERMTKPSTMSALECRVALRALGRASLLQAAQDVSGNTIHLWCSGELPVPERAAKWLRAQVGTAFSELGWRALALRDRDGFERQLRRELSAAHPLAGRDLTALARALGSDDVAFFADDGTIALVHLTYAPPDPEGCWPYTVTFPDVYALLRNLASDGAG